VHFADFVISIRQMPASHSDRSLSCPTMKKRQSTFAWQAAAQRYAAAVANACRCSDLEAVGAPMCLSRHAFDGGLTRSLSSDLHSAPARSSLKVDRTGPLPSSSSRASLLKDHAARGVGATVGAGVGMRVRGVGAALGADVGIGVGERVYTVAVAAASLDPAQNDLHGVMPSPSSSQSPHP